MLEQGRVTETFAHHLDRWEMGSGYLISPRLVLTAAHVVVKDGVAAHQVVTRPLGDDRKLAGRVVWWRDDDSVDAAVIEIVDPDWVPPELPPLRWGRLTGQRGGVRCEAIGFPNALRDMRRRDTDQLGGVINPGTRIKAHRHDILVDSEPAEWLAWRGVSGAAVFCGDLLTAVVTAAPEAFAGRRLSAVPIQQFVHDPEFSALVGTIEAESVELSALFDVPVRNAVPSPAFLLRADAEVVPFRGRAGLLDELTAWCRTADAVSARLVTGPGGQGKTRLARELAARLRREGWVTGWLSRSAGRSADQWDRLADSTVPVLVIVDYVEARTEQLRQLVDRVGTSRPAGLRLLLLARTSGEWWPEVVGSTTVVGSILIGTKIVRLSPLDETVAEREDGFHAAARHFARALRDINGDVDWPALATTLRPPPGLSSPRYDCALALQMAALVCLLQAGPAPAPAGDEFDDTLLHHEKRYWRDTAQARGLDFLRGTTLALAVATATLVSADTEAHAAALLATLPGLRDQTEDRRLQLAEWLHDLYPATGGEYWGQLRPDRIGEHLVGQLTVERPDAFDGLIGELSDWQAREMLIVLSRASARHGHVAGLITRLVHGRPEQLAAAAIWGVMRTDHPGPLIEAVQPLADNLADHPELLHKLAVLAQEVATLGGWAKTAADNIIAQYQRLAEDDPATYSPLLANALHSKAQGLLKIGGSTKDLLAAVRAAKHSIAQWRQLDGNPGQSAGLATALDVLTVVWLKLKRPDRALPYSRESVEVFERLAADPEGDADPRLLIQALNHLSSVLKELGHREQSLDAAQRAFALYERIKDPGPLDVLTNTDSLVNIANRLMDTGDPENMGKALAGYREVVDRRREVSESYPNIFDGDLASAWYNLAKALVRAGRPNEALEPFDQAIETYRRAAALRPHRYLKWLQDAVSSRTATILADRARSTGTRP